MMETYEKRIIVQYFQQSSELLKEIRRHGHEKPGTPLPEILTERTSRLLGDYADWMKAIAQIVELEGNPDWAKPPYLLP